MKNFRKKICDYANEHNDQLRTGLIAFGVFFVVIGVIGLFIYNSESKQIQLDYTPISACSLFSADDAKVFLGEDIIDNNTKTATVVDNRATSQCSYTDQSASDMAVIAVSVKSAINSRGVQDNKDDFALSKEANTVELVTGVGDEAFYVPANGQLNILYGRIWLLVMYGKETDTSSYTLDNALKVARKILSSSTTQK